MVHKDSDGQMPHVATLGESVNSLADEMSHAPASAQARPTSAQMKFFSGRKAEEKQRGRQFRNDRLRQDMDLRERHAEKAVGLAQAAVTCWLLLFALAGCVNLTRGERFLSDQALVTLTAGATVNVIAVFLVVVKGLFPPPVPEKSKTKKKKKAGQRKGRPGEPAAGAKGS